METIEENRNLSEDEKLRRLKIAKDFGYDDWKPYCMMCQKSPRMIAKDSDLSVRIVAI